MTYRYEPAGVQDETRRSIRFLATALLPVIRRTLQVGNGPSFIKLVARSLCIDLTARTAWTSKDEQNALTLASRVSRLLTNRKEMYYSNRIMTGPQRETVDCAALKSTVQFARGT
jgi:hypothetical protein